MIDARTSQSLSTSSAEAADQYQLAVDRILGSETGAAEALDRALALDSNFALALAARYMLAKDAKSTGANIFKERAVTAAEAALPWERAHIQTGAWDAADVGRELVPVCAHGPAKGRPKKRREAA